MNFPIDHLVQMKPDKIMKLPSLKFTIDIIFLYIIIYYLYNIFIFLYDIALQKIKFCAC